MTDLLYLALIGGFLAGAGWYVSAIATFASVGAPPPPTAAAPAAPDRRVRRS
ncbi:MAG: hypothetical protein R2761_27660 [Acidimicrobiales bacterium]